MKPGTDQAALQHEAGDRVYVLSSQFSAFVAAHSFVAGNPDLADQAKRIEDAMGALYQAIWADPAKE